MAIIGGAGAAGFAFVNVPIKDVIMELLPDSDTADVSAIFSTCTQVASSIGSALFVGILSADVLSHRRSRDAERRLYVRLSAFDADCNNNRGGGLRIFRLVLPADDPSPYG